MSTKQDNPSKQRAIIEPQAAPCLTPQVRLHHDKARGRWVLLAPERLVELNDSTLATLRLCDGSRSVTDIAAMLAREYNAVAEDILQDIIGPLQYLADRHFICSRPPETK